MFVDGEWRAHGYAQRSGEDVRVRINESDAGLQLERFSKLKHPKYFHIYKVKGYKSLFVDL